MPWPVPRPPPLSLPAPPPTHRYNEARNLAGMLKNNIRTMYHMLHVGMPDLVVAAIDEPESPGVLGWRGGGGAGRAGERRPAQAPLHPYLFPSPSPSPPALALALDLPSPPLERSSGVVMFRSKAVEVMRHSEVLLAAIVEHVHGVRGMKGGRQPEVAPEAPMGRPPSLRTVRDGVG
jgi:hypothetical protein